ncbi:hypothetical protein ACFP7A_00730 [Sporolactobacillus kofuensis]|uniref:Uncharacterized protein n=1 Tax=Sporolactobacillus kofuensis TaxID=269672 RepID=A0ABW1W979_9BACL|nr:hypothetical protein [Sporolactobacillus kofuensis]MCO7175573.1 hypothetical protein [Sporolactobacillus kofuensis]
MKSYEEIISFWAELNNDCRKNYNNMINLSGKAKVTLGISELESEFLKHKLLAQKAFVLAYINARRSGMNKHEIFGLLEAEAREIDRKIDAAHEDD